MKVWNKSFPVEVQRAFRTRFVGLLAISCGLRFAL
jgi:hypothetical protein